MPEQRAERKDMVSGKRSQRADVLQWQQQLYELAQNQQENRFAEITPQAKNRRSIAVTVQIGSVELAIHNGADAATIEAVMRAVKSC